MIRWLEPLKEGETLTGPDLEQLARRREAGIGPAAYWHSYGADSASAACDPYASLLPVLAMLCPDVYGAIEFGGGAYSTPLLFAGRRVVDDNGDDYCADLRTIETDDVWARRCGPMGEGHRVGAIDVRDLRERPDAVLAELGMHQKNGTLVLLDGGPREEDRTPLLLCEEIHKARYIVLHDAEHRAFAGVDWARWRFAVMVKNHLVWTAVVSDVADPMPLLRHLPGVERVGRHQASGSRHQ